MQLYETDFRAWALEQARRLRSGESVDVEHVSEELEGLGRSEQQQLVNRLAALIAHWLKWEYQTENRSRNWLGTIHEQQKRIKRLLARNPSLTSVVGESIEESYEIAVTFASVDTGIIEDDFPAGCPYTLEQLLSEPC